MTQATNDELLVALAVNDLQIKQTAARILDHVTDDEWRAALDRIVELRELREELEEQLARLSSPT
jgi:hypothetical protein